MQSVLPCKMLQGPLLHYAIWAPAMQSGPLISSKSRSSYEFIKLSQDVYLGSVHKQSILSDVQGTVPVCVAG